MSNDEFILTGEHLEIIRLHVVVGHPKSQQSFAEQLGWTQKAFSTLENKKRNEPLPKKLAVMLKQMGCVAQLKLYLEKQKGATR